MDLSDHEKALYREGLLKLKTILKTEYDWKIQEDGDKFSLSYLEKVRWDGDRARAIQLIEATLRGLAPHLLPEIRD